MRAGRGEPEEIDYIDKSDLEVGKIFSQQDDSRQRLLGRDITGAGDDHIRLASLVVTRLGKDAEPFGAVGNGLVHRHVLEMLLFVRDDDVDVVGAFEAVIRYTQER